MPFPLTAWVAHIYTASGAALAFLALDAIVSGNIRAAFLWLATAVVIDASDGVMARAARVRERLPAINGSHLDDIVDYLTYVLVPLFLLYHTNRLPAGWGFFVVFAILVASAIAFVKSDAKSSDHFFTGFPSYWNVVVFYLYAAGSTVLVNALVLLFLCVLIFVRIGYIYPSRTTTLRFVTVLFGSAWAVLMLFLVLQLPDVSRGLLALSLVFPAYYTALSYILHFRRQTEPSGPAMR